MTVPAEPFATLAEWLPDPSSGDTPVMTLSTIGLDGYPAARTVLLSRFDGRRLHFHTDADSRKVAELTATPRATVTLLWPEAARQLVVTGDVTRVSGAEARTAYRDRSRYLQVLAWLNDHDLAALGADERRTRWADFEREHAGLPLEPPPGWAGFAIDPVRVSSWRGATDAPSNRVVHERRADGGWSVTSRAG
ncbi:pyridoxine 5'-phosphate oxidase [Curtobacterium sp. 'Ferrero']|uniref:pyridoxine/pyridoxamine 5'-phosphate oxidase n=1 Tax=Curtobacterium sp. 'Ferrero' TaxID=2033654 RepID=UPI000BD665CC|nr:pyridoxamine 5'-phosphate oxidase family protein [Curtobacterium sp. 'Ferrero']PCN47790.1 pyridoxine 5'-phosphate oxidase [Curtobacterium sp. 'Ferrero']